MKNELNKIEKKLFIITAILLTGAGAVFGLYIAEILASQFEELGKTQEIVSKIAISALFALILLSLSKPLSKLFFVVTEKIQGTLLSRPAYKNMSFVFGLMLGITVTVVGGYFLNRYAKIDPTVKFIILLVGFAIFTYVAIYVFEKILGGAEASNETCKGYVIALSALTSDKILMLAPKLVGKIAVMDVTVSRLTTELADAQVKGESTEEQERAFRNYVELKKLVNLQFATGNVHVSELDNLVNLYKTKKLRIIANNPLELFDDDEVDVLYLMNLA